MHANKAKNVDVIGEITFSRRFGFMDAQKDDGIFSQIKVILKSGTWLGQVPWVYWIHDFMMPLIGNHLGVNLRHGKLRTYTEHEVQQRKDRDSDHQDILGKLFQVQKDKPSDFSVADVTSMAASNINAGSDTTAISLRAIVYYLLKNPEYKKKLLEEIDSMSMAGMMAGVVTLEQSRTMPYFQSVMYEALRLHPAVGMSLPRVTPAGGIVIDEHFIPGGVI
jgi:cytochrome P450